jgi:hypothetical protein
MAEVVVDPIPEGPFPAADFAAAQGGALPRPSDEFRRLMRFLCHRVNPAVDGAETLAIPPDAPAGDDLLAGNQIPPLCRTMTWARATAAAPRGVAEPFDTDSRVNWLELGAFWLVAPEGTTATLTANDNTLLRFTAPGEPTGYSFGEGQAPLQLWLCTRTRFRLDVLFPRDAPPDATAELRADMSRPVDWTSIRRMARGAGLVTCVPVRDYMGRQNFAMYADGMMVLRYST